MRLQVWLGAGWILVGIAGCKNDAIARPEATQPVPVASPSTTGAPTRFTTFRALLRASDLPLAKAAHCENVIGADAGKSPTLGDWVAYNLSVLENGALDLPASCTPDGSSFRCKVEFSVRNDGENT